MAKLQQSIIHIQVLVHTDYFIAFQKQIYMKLIVVDIPSVWFVWDMCVPSKNCSDDLFVDQLVFVCPQTHNTPTHPHTQPHTHMVTHTYTRTNIHICKRARTRTCTRTFAYFIQAPRSQLAAEFWRGATTQRCVWNDSFMSDSRIQVCDKSYSGVM